MQTKVSTPGSARRAKGQAASQLSKANTTGPGRGKRRSNDVEREFMRFWPRQSALLQLFADSLWRCSIANSMKFDSRRPIASQEEEAL